MSNNLLFIHVPKTAGQSIGKGLEHINRDVFVIRPSPKGIHFTYTEYEEFNYLPDFFIFTVVRNPYRRAYSYYKQYQRRNNYNQSLEYFLRFIDKNKQFVTELTDKKPHKLAPSQRKLIHNLHQSESGVALDRLQKPDLTPFIFLDQSYFLKNNNNQIKVDKIYKFENINELEQDLNINLDKVNVGDYDQQEYYKDYNTLAIDLVKDIYSEDFTNFEYSTEFT